MAYDMLAYITITYKHFAWFISILEFVLYVK